MKKMSTCQAPSSIRELIRNLKNINLYVFRFKHSLLNKFASAKCVLRKLTVQKDTHKVMNTFIGRKPVSYTHLDVYKRQIYIIQLLLTFFYYPFY